MRLLGLFLLMALLACQSPAPAGEPALLWLRSPELEAAIRPELGGRLVWLSRPGQPNVLKVHPDLLQPAALDLPPVTATDTFRRLNGHSVWLGPQSAWWTQQDLLPDRRAKAPGWPPDPFLTQGTYALETRTDQLIRLRSPESPVSGLVLRKTYELLPAGGLRILASAVNIRPDTVAWSLWHNTRLPGHVRAYVPADSSGLLRLKVTAGPGRQPMPYTFAGGYFSFLPSPPSDTVRQHVQKAFLSPRSGYIFAEHAGQRLEIRFDPVAPDAVAPGQAPVEIYNMMSHQDSLLELEVHGPYHHLAPGDSLKLAVVLRCLEG